MYHGPSLFRIGCLLLATSLAATLLSLGCNEPTEEISLPPEPPNYYKPLPPGEKALVKLTDPSRYPDFSEGYYRKAGLETAALYSLEYLSKPSSQQFYPYLDVSHERVEASLRAFLDVLHRAMTPEEFDALIKERFEIYQSRGCDEVGTVLFTGYYRPIFDARLEPTGEYRYPLYRAPDDLERNEATNTYQRAGGGAYYSRGEIMNGVLADRGLELCYLRDPFEAYIITVQGSARLRLGPGRYYDIGYDADNGHEYSSIGQELVSRNLIAPSQLSLQGLIQFFQENPSELDRVLPLNARYVFFTERSGGPFGSLNVPVTPQRSIATDKDVYPRAAVAFMQTQIPAHSADGVIRNQPYAGFALDQDTGGAIRAAGRCDVFLGTGPEVGELAGRTFAEGQLYYIFVKPEWSGASRAHTGTLASPTAPTAHDPDMSEPMNEP